VLIAGELYAWVFLVFFFLFVEYQVDGLLGLVLVLVFPSIRLYSAPVAVGRIEERQA
jgi:hypothetical protein